MNDWQREGATFIRAGWFAGMCAVGGTGVRCSTTVSWARAVTVRFAVARTRYIDVEMNTFCWLWCGRNCK